MNIGPLGRFIESWHWGKSRPHLGGGGVKYIIKTYIVNNNIIFWNCPIQRVIIWYVTWFCGYLEPFIKLCPWGKNWPPPVSNFLYNTIIITTRGVRRFMVCVLVFSWKWSNNLQTTLLPAKSKNIWLQYIDCYRRKQKNNAENWWNGLDINLLMFIGINGLNFITTAWIHVHGHFLWPCVMYLTKLYIWFQRYVTCESMLPKRTFWLLIIICIVYKCTHSTSFFYFNLIWGWRLTWDALWAKQGLIHVRKESSQMSLCSPHRPIWDETFRFNCCLFLFQENLISENPV